MTLDALKKAGVPVLAYGNFITIAVNFVILAFIIFLMVKQINRLQARDRRRAARRRGTARGRRAAARDSRQPARGPEPTLASRLSWRATRTASIRLAGSARPRAGDVERRAVVGAGAHQRQAQRDVHALLHAEVLHRDQALVVVHRDHHIELAGPCRRPRARA